MAASPDQLTQDIATTRQRMGGTLDQVQDRVDPRSAWQRRQPAMRSKVAGLKDTVMGTADDMAGRVGDGAAGVTDRLSHGTQGNPLAAGLVAFGAGLLAGSIMPSSRVERRVVSDLQERVEEPLTQALSDSGEEIRNRVGEEAHQVVDHTREVAADAGHEVVGSASESAQHIRDEAATAAHDVRRDIEGG